MYILISIIMNYSMYYFISHYDHANTIRATTISETGRLCLRQSIAMMLNKMQINRKSAFNCCNDPTNSIDKASISNDEFQHFIHNQPILTNTLGDKSIDIFLLIDRYIT